MITLIAILVTMFSLVIVSTVTSTDILEQVKRELGKNAYNDRLLSVLVFLVISSFLSWLVVTPKSSLLAISFSINLFATGLAYFTDVVINRINRFALRLAYILNYAILLTYSGYSQMTEQYIALILSFVILGIMFFTITNVGASDFRCMMINIPTLLIVAPSINKGLIVVALLLGIITIYQKTKQKQVEIETGEKKAFVPIAFPYMLTSSLSLFLLLL